MSAVDLRQLALMLALHDTQSLSVAAQSLHMTPPAARQSLQRLRDALGDEIVVRQGTGYRATPFGEGALAAFRDIVRLWADSTSAGGAFDPQASEARWALACAEAFTEIDLDACYAAIVAQAPRVRLDIVAQPPGAEGWAALRAARIDVLLTCEPPPADADDLHAERFPDAVLSHCCLSVTHPRIGTALSLARLAREPHVRLGTPDGGEGASDPIDEALIAGGFAPRASSSVPTLARWAAILATTDRVAIVSLHQGAALARHAEGLRLLALPEGLPRLSFPRFMAWHHRTHGVQAQRWLRERLRGFVFTGPSGWSAQAMTGR